MYIIVTYLIEILQPVMLSSLHDQSPLVVVVVDSRCFQTDGAFMDQWWMQRVQSRNILRSNIYV